MWEKYKSETTLAIGDGANDIDMLSAAHIGVSVDSPFGYQLSKYSDAAIS